MSLEKDIKEILKEDVRKAVVRAIKINKKAAKKAGVLPHPIYLSSNRITKEEYNIMDEKNKENIENLLEKKKDRYYFVGITNKDYELNPRTFFQPGYKDVTNITIRWLLSLLGGNTVKLKNRLCRLVGMKIGKGVRIYQGTNFDPLAFNKVQIGDYSVLGGDLEIDAHATDNNCFIMTYVKIGKNCLIGKGTKIGGLNMEDNVEVTPYTVLAGHEFYLPKNSLWEGNPPRRKKRSITNKINK